MPSTYPTIRIHPCVLTPLRETVEYRLNILHWHHVPDRPPELVGDPRIVKPFRPGGHRGLDVLLYPLRMRPANIQAKQMIGTLVSESGYMVGKVGAEDRIILKDHQVGAIRRGDECAQMIRERSRVILVEDDMPPGSLRKGFCACAPFWDCDDTNFEFHDTVSSCTDVTAVNVPLETPPGPTSTLRLSIVANMGAPALGVLK